MTGIRVIAAPTVEPISLADAKDDLRVDHADDDEKLRRFIFDAREFVEKRCQKKFAQQTIQYVLDAFPSTAAISLPVAPVKSITSIEYDDVDSVEQTMPQGDYVFDDISGKVFLAIPVAAWPTSAGVNSVRITFVAGMLPALVPGPVKNAIRLKVQELYDGDDRSRAINDLLTNYYTMVA